MKKTVAKRWLTFLHRKRKATGAMGGGGGSKCCLGHLTQMYADEKGLKAEWDKSTFGPDRSVTLPGGPTCMGSFPDSRVLKWSGLTISDCEDLANLNDSEEGFPKALIRDLGGLPS